MKLFRKKKEASCCCGEKCTPENMMNAEQKKNDTGIKILGSGCAKCVALEKATRNALEELNLEFEIEHITDFVQIASYGVMSTPALVFNGKVLSYGKVLTIDEVKKLLEEAK